MTLAYLEENILNPSSTAADVSSKISILDAVNFVAKSWWAVKEATIYCFRKASFFTLSSSIDDGDEDENFTSDTLEVTNGSEYNDIDDDLPCCGESDELDDEIIEAIIAKRSCLQDSDSGSEMNDDTDPVTHAEAKLHILRLQRYFTQQGFSDEAHYCTHLVDSKCATTLKQTYLHQFTQN